jgi:hypothetical protein
MRKISLVFGLALLACCACNAVTPATAPASASARSATPAPSTDLLAQIRGLIGTPACTDNAQCHTLPLGARPCGGPQSYVAWSSAHTDGAALRALGLRYQEQQRARDAAAGMVSDCRFIPDPGALCRAGTCQLNASGPAAI